MKALLQKLGLFKKQKTPTVNDRVEVLYLKEYRLTGKVVSKVSKGYFVLQLDVPEVMFGTLRRFATVNEKEIV